MPAAAPAVSRSEIAPAPEAAIASAREAARTAPSLEALRALLENFDGCALKHTATRLVFSDGNPQARIMFVGEAPGRDEDIEGLPFVGRSGKLLDRMIAAIGLDRSKAYIANVIPWRPPGNRTPTPQETQICLPFIQRQIELVNPDVLVTLGNPSTQTLLSTREGIMKTRGKWFDYDTGTRTIRAIATFHPAYLLRSPSYKRMSWQDLRAIAKALEKAASVSWERRSLRRARRSGPTRGLRWVETREDALLTIRDVAVYGAFGRTMAQPTRSSGCRPFTIHSNARGTSGTRPGKRCAISAGGVPEVSEARQTTTPPVSLNFASDSHGVRSGVASSNRCGRPCIQRDEARELRIAGHRAQPLVGAPLKTVAEEMRDRARRQRGRHFGAAGPGQEQRGRDGRESRRCDRRGPDRAQQPLAPQIDQIAGRDDHGQPRHQQRNAGAAGDAVEIEHAGDQAAEQRRADRERNRRTRAPADRPAAGR